MYTFFDVTTPHHARHNLREPDNLQIIGEYYVRSKLTPFYKISPFLELLRQRQVRTPRRRSPNCRKKPTRLFARMVIRHLSNMITNLVT